MKTVFFFHPHRLIENHEASWYNIDKRVKETLMKALPRQGESERFQKFIEEEHGKWL